MGTKIDIYWCLLIICIPAYLCAEPPVAGGFITDLHNSIYVYWYHPEINCYELSLIGENAETHKAPAQEPGYYCIAQAIPIPQFSYISNVSTIVFDAGFDPVSGLNQTYNFLDFALFENDRATVPGSDYFFQGEFMAGDFDLDNLVSLYANVNKSVNGNRFIWCGAEWNYDLPSRPQILMDLWDSHYYGMNKMGVGDGESYSWQDFPHLPLFRTILLTPYAIDTAGLLGTYKKMTPIDQPQGFRLISFEAKGEEEFNYSSDSLLTGLGTVQVDSVIIISKYNDYCEDEGLKLIYDSLKVLPVMLAQSNDTLLFRQGLAQIGIQNLSNENLILTVFANDYDFEIFPGQFELMPNGILDLEIKVKDSVVGVEDLSLFFHCKSNLNYYPKVMNFVCKSDQTTGIINEPPLPDEYLLIYPNPIGSGARVRIKTNYNLIRLEIYDILGRKINTLFSGKFDGEMSWDGRDSNGNLLPSGIYMVRTVLRDGNIKTKKMIILK